MRIKFHNAKHQIHFFRLKFYRLAPKIPTFADCFERKMNGLLRSSQRRKATTKKSRVPKSRVKQQIEDSTKSIKQFNSQQLNIL